MLPRLESIALELLEYKVEEFSATRKVRGGSASLWELLSMLQRERGQLNDEERVRLEYVSTRLSAVAGARQTESVPDLVSLILADETESLLADSVVPARDERVATNPAEREEHAILQRLARRVWWDDLEEFVQRVAAGWLAEQDRLTARLVFATLQNLHRNADRSTFGRDVALRGFRVIEPMPDLRDPLVALSDLDTLGEIMRELVNLIMTLGKVGNPLPELEISEAGAFGYVREAAFAVAADPYAGRISPRQQNSPTSQQLRLVIQELSKERLADDEKAAQRRALERRLVEVSARERNDRKSFQQNTAVYKDLMHSFFERLAEYLPTSVGGRASGPQLEGGVLFGANPILKWDRVPADATAVSIRMVGPVRLTLNGHDLAIAGVGPERTLYLDGHELELDGTNVVKRGRTRVSTYREGDYVHVRIRDLERSLAARIADAMVAVYVLSSSQSDELMSMLKVLANNVRGEPHEVVAQAITRASAVSARAPDQVKALDGLIRGSARAAQVLLTEESITGLVKRIKTSIDGDELDLTAVISRSGVTEHQVRTLTGEPLSFDLGGLKITVRQYRGRGDEAHESLVAMLPGQVLGSFNDHLLTPRHDGTLVFARGEEEVAVLFIAGTGTTVSGEQLAPN